MDTSGESTYAQARTGKGCTSTNVKVLQGDAKPLGSPVHGLISGQRNQPCHQRVVVHYGFEHLLIADFFLCISTSFLGQSPNDFPPSPLRNLRFV